MTLSRYTDLTFRVVVRITWVSMCNSLKTGPGPQKVLKKKYKVPVLLLLFLWGYGKNISKFSNAHTVILFSNALQA